MTHILIVDAQAEVTQQRRCQMLHKRSKCEVPSHRKDACRFCRRIVKQIDMWGVDMVFVVGGNGGNAGANAIQRECEKEGVVCSVTGIPKSIDNDILLVRLWETVTPTALRQLRESYAEIVLRITLHKQSLLRVCHMCDRHWFVGKDLIGPGLPVRIDPDMASS